METTQTPPAIPAVDVLSLASGISTQWSVAAFAIAAILIVVVNFIYRPNKQTAVVVNISCVLIITIAALPILANYLLSDSTSRHSSVYRIRTTTVNAEGQPVETDRIWSTLGGEPKKVPGGWEIDIPISTKPNDGKITIFASQSNAFLFGQVELTLATDLNPAVIIPIKKNTSADIRGAIQDNNGKSVEGATVSVIGYGAEAIKTGADGAFVLHAHAASDQQVLVHVEKLGFRSTDQWLPAGSSNVIVLGSK